MSRLRTGQANDWRVHLSPEIVINLDNENSHARFAQFVRDLKVIYPEDDVQKKAKEVNKFRKFKFGTETSKDYVVAKKSLFGLNLVMKARWKPFWKDLVFTVPIQIFIFASKQSPRDQTESITHSELYNPNHAASPSSSTCQYRGKPGHSLCCESQSAPQPGTSYSQRTGNATTFKSSMSKIPSLLDDPIENPVGRSTGRPSTPKPEN
ncbi:unnamed protein product [Allacma fusca]|uniref:Uncharacterized protein n=1 Tax=Allacma fusca TaxID=39272 RepID=A0A8J2J4I8_9HEXA|nr:unnamed protein product [Allacma fusca]